MSLLPGLQGKGGRLFGGLGSLPGDISMGGSGDVFHRACNMAIDLTGSAGWVFHAPLMSCMIFRCVAACACMSECICVRVRMCIISLHLFQQCLWISLELLWVSGIFLA